MNRYAILFLSLFTLAGHSGPGNAHPANTSQLASARQAAEPDRDDATAATVPAEQRPSIRYSKLEAAVQLEHDYDGRMQPDVTETLTLRFRHGYTSGWMQLEFYAHDGLELYNAELPRALPLDAAQPLSVPIQLTAPSAGEHYLSIFATVQSADGEEVGHRIFGLDLKAGDESEIASQARRSSKTDRVEETPSGELIIVMPVEETSSSP